MNRSWEQLYRTHRFGVLLVMLIMLTLGTALTMELQLSGQWFRGALSVLTFAAIASLCFERHQRIYSLTFGVPTIVFSWAGELIRAETANWTHVTGQVCGVLFLMGTAFLIVRSLFSASTLTADSVYGAICGYVFLGIGWAVIFSMIEGFWPGSFLFNSSLVPTGQAAQSQPDVMVYYSFITLTTVGYGDISPISPLTRTLAWIEAISGQFYLAVVVAGIVSMLAARQEPLRGE